MEEAKSPEVMIRGAGPGRRGEGFIGSKVASALLDAGDTPVVADSLVTGRRECTAGRILCEGHIADADLVHRVLNEHTDIEAVMPLTALISVPESVADPVGSFGANVVEVLAFSATSAERDVTRLVFSSPVRSTGRVTTRWATSRPDVPREPPSADNTRLRIHQLVGPRQPG